jgi:hypothetical protein
MTEKAARTKKKKTKFPESSGVESAANKEGNRRSAGKRIEAKVGTSILRETKSYASSPVQVYYPPHALCLYDLLTDQD